MGKQKYKLKEGQEAFEMVDGPMAGQKFKPGFHYEEIPDRYKDRFQKVKKQTAKPMGKKTETAGGAKEAISS